MKLVADENIERSLIVRLHSEGHEVFSIGESMQGATDSEVMQIANEAQGLIFNQGQGFW